MADQEKDAAPESEEPKGEAAAEATSAEAEANEAPAQAAEANEAATTEAPAQAAETAEEAPNTVLVRYGSMGQLGRFSKGGNEELRCGRRVVIKSDRGMEMGTVVGFCCRKESFDTVPQRRVGEVLRPVTHADIVDERHLIDGADRKLAFCRERIEARQLPMKLVMVEHLFGGDRIIFYFVAESRVDFRALVRDLAHEFQTRIEMRQIGVRDEARLLGDYERCGRPLCCRAFMKDLAPVSMKMAKVQKATLDPAKISGHCGRLMCCLRFEQATYQELKKSLPRRNTYVLTHEGLGKVVDADVVSQMAGVILEGGVRVNVPVETILERDVNPDEVKRERPEAAAGRGRSADRSKAPATTETKPEEPKKDDAKSGKNRSRRRRRPRGRRRKKSKGDGGKGSSGGGAGPSSGG